MTDYIVCLRKRNSPRLSVRICKEKCPFKDTCKEYLAYQKMSVKPEQVPVPHDSTPVAAALP
jgi:hypothetical protein